LSLPDPKEEVMPGLPWGRCDELFTPAFWKAQAWFNNTSIRTNRSLRIGRSLREEVGACLLGGYGILAETALAAFYRLRRRGFFDGDPPGPPEIRRSLSEPLVVNGRPRRYRFAEQKSRYLSAALQTLTQSHPPHLPHRAFRDWFLQLPGVGHKTASWITRNWLCSNEVAIVDIHVERACRLTGLFRPESAVPRDYLEMEARYLAFASAIEVEAAFLDAEIWRVMRSARTSASITIRQVV
jgi:hypothetical protein